MGQQPPSATGPRHIGAGLEDCALGVFRWSSARFGGRHIGFDQRPLAVCEIGRVRWSGFHTLSLPYPPSAVGDFFNTL
jgi:hypothetical protein